MIESLKLFNVFGMVTIRRDRVVALATAVLPSGLSCEKTLARDVQPAIAGLPDNKAMTLLFAASLREGARAEVAVQQVSARAGGHDVIGEPAVQNIIEDVVNLVRKSV